MRRLTNWLARSAFGIGCAIGIVLGPTMLPALESRALGATRLDPPQCTTSPSLPQSVRDWIALQCAVHAAIFADNTEPTAIYKFTSAIAAPGTYTGLDMHNRPVTIAVVQAIQVDIKNNDPALHAMGVEMYAVYGQFGATAGQVPVYGTLLLPTGITEDTGYLFSVNGILTSEELDTHAMCSRILAGPRVVNTATGQSQP